MQQEQITLESVELFEIQEQVAAVSRGPMQLRPEILAWVSGGVSSELLPNATWQFAAAFAAVVQRGGADDA